MSSRQIYNFCQLGFASTVLAVILEAFSSPVVAQIIPDGTLPANSLVAPNGTTFEISGGTTVGSNLFHSFASFSVPTNATAFFNNASSIDRIIARVTGGQASNIDGLLKANGTADLFLINPSGILFGNNARLDLGGSFIGSTADGIQFADGSVFSATNPNTPPLLSVNVPIGLQIGANPGEIRLQGAGHEIDQPQLSPHIRGRITGLQVLPGKTLALIGGNITLDGGMLTAESGRIELGGVANGQVSLSPIATGWSLGYNGVENFRDIALLSQSAVDTSGAPGGTVQIQGQNLELRDGSLVLIQNQGSQRSGDIVVNLSGAFVALGLDPDGTPPSRLDNETVSAGDTGDIKISAQRVELLEGGQINTITFSNGSGGDILLNVSDSVRVDGFALDAKGDPFLSNIFAVSIGSGAAGDIALSARQLTILNGGVVSSTVFAFGQATGSGGNVLVNATGFVEIAGFSPSFAGSNLSASTFNAGNAGSITVNTGRLVIRDGGRVDANTVASGNAGNVTINASESVEVSGTVQAAGLTTPSLVGSAANAPDPLVQQFFGLPAVPSGSPGNVAINTPLLRVSDGALITVKNDGSGDAGNLSVRANSIFLNNRGAIAASTASGSGGNITLQVRDLLLLRNNSIISAEAGSRTGTGNGGNLILNSPLIVAVSEENSDIIANAFAGNGGNIDITTNGIFGLTITQGPLNDSISEINASSRTGIAGIVAITRPEVDTSAGLVELPQEIVDSSDQVIVGCAAAQGNSFTITGRGGLPEDPTATIRTQTVWEDLQDRSVAEETARTISVQPQPKRVASPVVEAKGWIINAAGNVELVARVPKGVRFSFPLVRSSSCS